MSKVKMADLNHCLTAKPLKGPRIACCHGNLAKCMVVKLLIGKLENSQDNFSVGTVQQQSAVLLL